MKQTALFCLVLSLLTALKTGAQPDFKPGFVVLPRGDTLYGTIDYRGDIRMGYVCRFRSDNSPEKQYYPGELQSYRFHEGRYFTSATVGAPGDERKVFLEYLVKGQMNVFYYRDQNSDDHYYVEKEGGKLTELPYAEGVRYGNNNVPHPYETTVHMDILRNFTADAPDLEPVIENIRKPDPKSLIRLAELYGKETCIEGNCIEYERHISFLKLAVEPVAGMLRYRGTHDFINEYGVLVYLWMPRSNEHVYFKTGFVHQEDFYKADPSTRNFAYYIPIQIRYVFSFGRMSPDVSFGMNTFTVKHYMGDPALDEHGNTLSLNAGLSYRLTRSLAVSAGLDSDFTSLIFVVSERDAKFGRVSSGLLVGLTISL